MPVFQLCCQRLRFSSSASIEVLLATIINALYNNNELEPLLLAKIGQYAENIYFGKPCGNGSIDLRRRRLCNIDFQDGRRNTGR